MRRSTPRRYGLCLLVCLVVLLAGAACRPTQPGPQVSSSGATLILYDWEGDMPQAVLEAFYQETGVQVDVQVYESQEEAVENMRAGLVYDVVVMESRFLPQLIEQNLVAPIHFQNITNFKNVSPNFRDPVYDPGNRYSIPYNWGSTALVVRRDLIAQRSNQPVTRWADLWDERYTGKVGLWRGQPRETIAMTLKSLGYSANSNSPEELRAAQERLLALRSHIVFLEDFDLDNAGEALASGQVALAMGYAEDTLVGQALNPEIEYIYPQEGALLWGDTFVIASKSPRQALAEQFLNFVLRPEINAIITNENHYATTNQAAEAFVEPEILRNPLIFPRPESFAQAEIILPLTPEVQTRYDQIWEQFLNAPSEAAAPTP